MSTPVDFHSEDASHLDTRMPVDMCRIEHFNWLYDQISHLYHDQPAMKRGAMRDAFQPVFDYFKQDPIPTDISSNDLVPVIQVLREACSIAPWGQDIDLGNLFRTRALDFTYIHMAACGIDVAGDPEARKMVADTFNHVVEIPRFDLDGMVKTDGIGAYTNTEPFNLNTVDGGATYHIDQGSGEVVSSVLVDGLGNIIPEQKGPVVDVAAVDAAFAKIMSQGKPDSKKKQASRAFQGAMQQTINKARRVG